MIKLVSVVYGMFDEKKEEEGRAGRSLFSEELDSMAHAVRRVVEVYYNLNEKK